MAIASIAKKFTLLVSAFSVIFILLAAPLSFAQADIQNSLCAGVNLDVNSSCSTGPSNTEIQEKANRLIKTVINLFSVVVGFVSVIMIIVGGFKYITSGGDSSNVTGAKNTIMYALIGLVIVALAQVIVRFVLSKVTQ